MSRIALLAVAAALLPVPAGADDRPNIIFILVDDQGYYDLGCTGGKEFDTPRIDRLAAEGIRFTDYYAAAPICSPSRAGLLTGCYPRRVGLATWVQRADSRRGIHPDELTLAELLRSNGYSTAAVGKWHLGFHPPFRPRRQGFDHYFGLLHNLDPVEVVHFKDQGGVPLIRNGEVVKRPADPAELTRLYTDEAIGFIERNRERPFFLYLPHTMAHVPLGVSEPFKGKSRMGLYGDVVMELDHHVGRLMDAVKRLGLEKRTIVVYASDNGRGPGRTPDQPIRGRKLSTLEGGIRVPCIVWGLRSGHVSSEVVHAMDWYPTLASLAGVKVPEGRVIDGRDLSPLLAGKTDRVPPPAAGPSLNSAVPLRRPWNPPLEWKDVVSREEYTNAFFYHGSQGALAAVRWDRWKLHLNPELKLYDLEKDPGESNPVRNRNILRKLRGMAVLFQQELERDARPAGRAEGPGVFDRDNLVAWCIVPFDAKKRGPAERAAMVKRLGLRKIAYDWRREHVPTFEEEILEYKKHGLEFFAFWGEHEGMFKLFEKHGLAPQVWRTLSSPKEGSQEEKVEAAGKRYLPLVERTRKLGSKLGLYNHGGWGGEPANLVAVVKWLRKNADAGHVGIVYNFHHGHGHIDDFESSLRLMKPYLHCLNLNGMNPGANPKILALGKGRHETEMMRIVKESGYRGPIGILDHRGHIDAEESLRENLEGMKKILAELDDTAALETYR